MGAVLKFEPRSCGARSADSWIDTTEQAEAWDLGMACTLADLLGEIPNVEEIAAGPGRTRAVSLVISNGRELLLGSEIVGLSEEGRRRYAPSGRWRPFLVIRDVYVQPKLDGPTGKESRTQPSAKQGRTLKRPSLRLCRELRQAAASVGLCGRDQVNLICCHGPVWNEQIHRLQIDLGPIDTPEHAMALAQQISKLVRALTGLTLLRSTVVA